ncbi:FeoC-like transcriptional regulator [Streptomyces fractus]|uniref:FeoC-like transcriptional regulator n=1 Tax=Streptomyces fractus TaxID=641806 RepID=UPI003CEC283A
MNGGSILRDVLRELRTSRAHSVDELATAVGASKDEVRAALDHWAARGRIALDPIGSATACASACAGCTVAATCGNERPAGPVLVAISPRRGEKSP